MKHLAAALDVAGAWVTEISPDRRKLRAFAFWFADHFIPDYEYTIENTPCQPVIERCSMFHVAENVIELFPRDNDLASLNAVSYLGLPLFDTEGAIAGNIGVLDVKPLPLTGQVEAVFRIFGARASAEIERLRSEQRVRDRERQLSSLLDGAWEPILEIDEDGKICHANLACAKKLSIPDGGLPGAGFVELLTPESSRRWRERMGAARRIQHGQPLWIDGLEAKGHEATLPVEASVCSFERDGRRFWTVILRDLHERREAERRVAALLEESNYLREELMDVRPLGQLIGESRAMQTLFGQLRQVAPTDATVLIQGESGTGKELIARAIHDASPRRSKPMIRVNCGAIPAALMESEFFGHEKGAFTGATERREGRFALADGGTLLLDEAGELPLDLQVKLLRVLQEGEFEPVGSSRTRKVNVRVIAATNRDLSKEVEQGRFRADLYYRLNVFPIAVPPLRDRGADIELLAEALIEKLGKKMNRRFHPLSRTLRDRLAAYNWPGNVRELENVLERAAILARGDEIAIDDRILPVTAVPPTTPIEETSVLTVEQLEALERTNLIRALSKCGWRIAGDAGAARLLGIAPSTLTSRMKALGISREKSRSSLA